MDRLTCPKCQSPVIKRNGYTRHGKQNLRCLECGRQFSIEPETNQEQYEEKTADLEIAAESLTIFDHVT